MENVSGKQRITQIDAERRVKNEEWRMWGQGKWFYGPEWSRHENEITDDISVGGVVKLSKLE